jgi:hypothetical protein
MENTCHSMAGKTRVQGGEGTTGDKQVPRILVGFSARQAETWLPTFLEQLDGLDYPEDKLRFAVCEGHSTDNTLKIVMDWLYTKQDWMLFKHNIDDTLLPRERMYYSSNLFHHMFKSSLKHYPDCDYIFKCDCDVSMIPPETLRTLIDLDVDIVAPYVYVDPEMDYNNMFRGQQVFYDGWGYRHRYGQYPGHQRLEYIHEYYKRNMLKDDNIKADKEKRLLPMTRVGANPVLIKRRVFNEVEYDGVHATPGFVEQAVKQGFHAWAYPDLTCYHTWRGLG